MNPLIVDLETTTPGPKPDMRFDEVTQVGWLPLDGDVAKWAECWCPLPRLTSVACHHAMYDIGIIAREAWADDGHVSPFITGPTHPTAGWLRDINIHDTLALAYTQGKQDLSLKGLGASELGVTTVPYAQRHLIGDEQYLAQDLFLTRDLLKKLLPMNEGTAYDIDRALIPALIDCSYRGYEVDQKRLELAVDEAEATRGRMESAFGRMTEGAEVLHSRRKRTRKSGVDYVEKHGPPSIGSPTQLARLLDTPDANKETLVALAMSGGERGILADLVGRWRKADKALTTYFYPLQGEERLTGLFNITPNEDMEGGTGTGRLSSERKNLQNQPPAVQRCLRAPDGYLLRRGDFPTIELRCAAEISGDPTMLEALSDPKRDLHQETADRLFGGDRYRGKQFNFQELYIGGEAVRRAYPRFYEWSQQHWASVQRTSYSVSPEPFLHKRFIPLLAGDHARKAAINHPVQSMAVYICKVAMNRLFQDGALLVNQVHDEIHDYVPEDCDRGLTARKMGSIMEECMKEYLPRVGHAPVEVTISKYWDKKGDSA